MGAVELHIYSHYEGSECYKIYFNNGDNELWVPYMWKLFNYIISMFFMIMS